LKKSGKVIATGSKKTLLEGLLAAEVKVPFEYKRGKCGLCVTDCTVGVVDHCDLYLTRAEKAQSLCLRVFRAKSNTLTLNI
jgi:vanillate O-demethylase ferredoxin subunit